MSFKGLLTSAMALGLFGFYLYSSYPTLSPYRDAGDMAASALTLGLAHPPGYPLYVLSAHAWLDIFRLGNVAFRLQCLSALLGVAACLCAWRSVGWGGAITFLLLGLSPAFWHLCLVSEMYSAHALIGAGLVYLLLPPQASQNFLHRVSAGALIFGLGLANHPSLILALPGLAWMCARPWWELAKPVFPSTLRLGAFFLCGLALYAYLPLRNLADPVVSWGDPSTARNFLRMLTRADYGGLRLHPDRPMGLTDISTWVSGLHYSAGLFLTQLGLSGTALFAWGVYAQRRSQVLRGILLSFFLTGPMFIVWANLDPKQPESASILEPHLVLPLVFAAVVAGFGARDMLERGFSHGRWGALAIAGLACGWFWPGSVSAGLYRQDYSAWDYGHGLLASLPPNSLLVDPDDPTAFTLSYLRHAHSRRPDIVAILYFRTRWGYEQLRRRHPELLPSWPMHSGQELLGTLVSRALGSHKPLYVDLPQKAPQGTVAIPAGLSYRLLGLPLDPSQRLRALEHASHFAKLIRFRLISLEADFFTRHTATYWSSALNNLGIEVQNLGRLDGAMRLYQRALTLNSNLAEAWNNWGNAALSQGHALAAEGCYRISLRIKSNPQVIYNLGRTYLSAGRYAEAEKEYLRAIQAAGLPDAMNDLGLVYLRSGRSVEAVRQWLGLLDRHPGYSLAYYNSALAYERLGQRQNARQAVAKFLELAQDEADKQEARRWLERLKN